MTKKHAILAPSTATIWMQCPASAQASALMPDFPSKWAREGTLAHEVAEIFAIKTFAHKGKGADIYPPINRDDYPDVTPYDFDEMIAGAKMYFDEIAPFVWGHLADVSYGLEKTISVYKDLCFGTADFMSYNFGDSQVGPCVAVVDYKFGKTKVHAKANAQMLCYAYGVMEECELSTGVQVRQVDLKIVQPRASTKEKVSKIRYTGDQVRKWFKNKVLPSIVEAMQPEPPRRPSAAACKWCKARTVCPEAGGYSQAAMDLKAELSKL